MKRLQWSLLPITEYDRMSNEWDQLNDTIGGAPFHHSTYIRNLLREFGSGNEYLAVGRNGNAIEAMGILARRKLGVWETFQPSQLPLGAWLMLPNLDYGDCATGMMGALPGVPLQVCFTQQDPRFRPRPVDDGRLRTVDYIETGWVAIEGSFDDYWKARSKSLRQNMRTQRSRLSREGTTTRMDVVTRADDVAEAIGQYARLESAGWKGSIGTAVTPGSAQGRFYQSAIEDYCRLGAGFVFRYWFNDRVVAAELHISRGDTMVLLKTAYDETVEGVSPAALMREEMYKQLFSDGGIRRMEYYGRVMDWTLRWTDRTRTLYHVNVYRWHVLAEAHAWLRRRRHTARPPASP